MDDFSQPAPQQPAGEFDMFGGQAPPQQQQFNFEQQQPAADDFFQMPPSSGEVHSPPVAPTGNSGASQEKQDLFDMFS